jgi:hypothetical protein
VEWFNTKDGTGNAGSKYLLEVYADSKADADAGEVYQMKGDPAKRLWALVETDRETPRIGCVAH